MVWLSSTIFELHLTSSEFFLWLRVINISQNESSSLWMKRRDISNRELVVVAIDQN
jgi:hypothetical protein